MSKYLGKGCGRPINKDYENPDWFCGDYLYDAGEYYYCDECNKEFTKEKQNHSQKNKVKKDVGTLSNSSSGDTKQGGINSQDDTKLQIERSASLPVDNQLCSSDKGCLGFKIGGNYL